MQKNWYHMSHPTWQTEYTQCGPEKYMKPPGSLHYKHTEYSTNNNEQQIKLKSLIWLMVMFNVSLYWDDAMCGSRSGIPNNAFETPGLDNNPFTGQPTIQISCIIVVQFQKKKKVIAEIIYFSNKHKNKYSNMKP